MAIKRIFRDNWLTRPPARKALAPTLALTALLLAGMLRDWPASPELVFGRHETWRAWTTLFAHAGWEHLLSNVVLFVPFSYALLSYFSPLLFPVLGFAVGGLVNLVVLKTLPDPVFLVGVSGVVYWMGAVWVTLALLIDRREKITIRVVKSLGVAMLLFLPEDYRPETSHLTHLLGFVSGILCALLYYGALRSRFRAAERYDLAYDFDAHWDASINAYSEHLPEDLGRGPPHS